LIVGILAALGGTITITKNLLKSELPIFLISTVHFIAAVRDGTIDRIEGLLLVGTFVAYLWYLRADTQAHDALSETTEEKPRSIIGPVAFALVGIAAVLVGAHYTVENAVILASSLAIPIGLVSIAAIAIGTSLPELFVSLQAIKTGETEMAIGNIFGSNAFNILIVVGIPALITPLAVDTVVMELGIWIFLGASVIFLVNGVSRRVMQWEGAMMLLFFAFFLVKLLDYV
jgi:cation:H+ antiporter